MSWMQKLYRTYENNIATASEEIGNAILAPIAHMVQNMQLEITIDEDGNFKSARKLEKSEGRTLIPVTESSAGRSSGKAPHALCDSLSYIAGDFEKYAVSSKEASSSHEKFVLYSENLKHWCESEYSHPKIIGVYRYISQKHVMWDLIESGIVKLEEEGKLSKDKIAGNPYDKVSVRFRVLEAKADAGHQTGVWEDEELINRYTDYYVSQLEGLKDICYVSGKVETIAVNHPKGIVAAEYGAKIISSNDKAGFTYRGRFTDQNQACTVGYESTQKIHNALTWLAAKQGMIIGSDSKRTYICWNPDGKKVMDPIKNDFDLYGDLGYSEAVANTEPEYKKKLFELINGYSDEFTDDDDIVVMSLEAATPGRLSITYYSELKALDFLDRIRDWNEKCCWHFFKWTEAGKPSSEIKPPSNLAIVRCAFGNEQSSMNGKRIDVNDKVLREHVQRILHCILNQLPIPFDIVNAIVEKAAFREKYSYRNYDFLLSTACAVLRKHYMDKKNDEIKGVLEKMELDVNCRNRSYLFGRLLAVVEKIERSAFDNNMDRETNAIRMQSAFVNHPMKTWLYLEDKIRFCYDRIPGYAGTKYKNLIGEIVAGLKENDVNLSNSGMLDKKLEPEYLLGYYTQRTALMKNKNSDKENDNANEVE